ncbi:AAA family ATPase [Actinophytocola gossypii]|uniref:Secreted protein n=1 Tax=Actinophytocola gossypii TaxID=2812003 RepID=A0ABT2J5C6_9PSEU|nr:AAA family ATPase [Actinophytocola gossypii]MCT2583064.1 hypothetical protein [Actinophytocola gossypii]
MTIVSALVLLILVLATVVVLLVVLRAVRAVGQGGECLRSAVVLAGRHQREVNPRPGTGLLLAGEVNRTPPKT